MEDVSDHQQQINEGSSTKEENDGNNRGQISHRGHERQQRMHIRKEGRDEESRMVGGDQDVSSRQREATQTLTNRQISGVTEEGQKRKVRPGSMTEAPEPSVKKISKDLSIDTDLYCMGRRSNRSSVPVSRQSGVDAGEGVDSKGQQLLPDSQGSDQHLSCQHAETSVYDRQQSPKGLPEPVDQTIDIQFSNCPEVEHSPTREPPSAHSMFADTAARLGGITDDVLFSNGRWTPTGEFFENENA